MDKKDIIEFFDQRAPQWDAEMVKSDRIIAAILDNANVGPGMDVLDVACGTGVMFDYYLRRGVASVTGIDISPRMAEIAAEKCAHEPTVKVICGDVEELDAEKKFDRIVLYNAFPHFPQPQKLIYKLASLLRENGRLTIAHGASREAIDAHHQDHASAVSMGLMPAESLKELLLPCFEVDTVISDDKMYQLCGTLRKSLTK